MKRNNFYNSKDINITEKIKRRNDYETVYLLEKGELYFAFHKDTSETLIQKLQNALEELKEQGEYQKILDKYLK